ncbi:hypothetical protein RQP46_009920 [Phenoliferia psychrophenolica]
MSYDSNQNYGWNAAPAPPHSSGGFRPTLATIQMQSEYESHRFPSSNEPQYPAANENSWVTSPTEYINSQVFPGAALYDPRMYVAFLKTVADRTPTATRLKHPSLLPRLRSAIRTKIKPTSLKHSRPRYPNRPYPGDADSEPLSRVLSDDSFPIHDRPQTTRGIDQDRSLYSTCEGKKKALCIGIEYWGNPHVGTLPGCHRDATSCFSILGMRWLVEGAEPNDSLFIHYSGHGTQVRDVDGDEPDGLDEMHEIMVAYLPKGCRLTALYDCCHSGSILDLPYTYSTNGTIKPNSYVNGLARATSHAWRGGYLSGRSMYQTAGNILGSSLQFRKKKSSAADCISWAACKDNEQADGTPTAGAMTEAFIAALNANVDPPTYKKILCEIREKLLSPPSGLPAYSQKPQLSCSHPFDCDTVFML